MNTEPAGGDEGLAQKPLAEKALAQKALRDLEWGRIVAAVGMRCRGPLRERLLQLPLASSVEETRSVLEETREAVSLSSGGEPLPIEEGAEIGATLARLLRGGVLEGEALYNLAKVAGAARTLRLYLAGKKSRAPTLREACATDPRLDGLELDLKEAIEPSGRLADHASPELAERRREMATLRDRIVRRLEALLVKRAELLSDRFFTVREGRHVLPVRADAHERVHGIVHGSSQSGATIFVEPRELVPLGNQLKMAEVEHDREQRRLLGVLTERAHGQLGALEEAVTALDRADLRQAAARLCADLGGTVPILSEAPELDLIEARHPLLVLEEGEVVPNAIPLEAGQALVISGPNAGGKTVSLKIVGLAALMARAGLPFSAAEGSRVGFFPQVFTDVGDEQSLSRSLSTFSAQLESLRTMLEESRPGSLVLLDEIAGGTDPEEGAALACAIVEGLTERGATLVATTHYELLKARAERSPRLRNASVGFDAEALAPTFHLHLDLPGASGALSIAKRFGLPAEVLAHAAELLPKDARDLDGTLRSLARRSAQLDREIADAEDAHRAARKARKEAEQRLFEAKQREEKGLGEEASKVLKALREARTELRRARSRVRQVKGDEAKLAAAQKTIDTVATKLKDEGLTEKAAPQKAASTPRGEPLGDRSLSVGDRVFVTHLGAEGEVLEVPKRGKIRVSAGPATLRVARDSLRLLARAQSPSRATNKRSPRRLSRSDASLSSLGGSSSGGSSLIGASMNGEATASLSIPGRDNTVDLRGLRVEEALTLTESFLDRAYGASQSVVYLLHGHGSGALRDAIRRHLPQLSRYVRRSRPGNLEEGGERLTVAYLK